MPIINHKPLAAALLMMLILPGLGHGADNMAALTLNQAIDYALANNPDMTIAEERIGQAQARLGVALSAFYPTVTARVSHESSNNPARVFAMIVAQRQFKNSDFANINQPGFHDNFRPEITGRISLFRGGQDTYRKEAAKLGIAAAELEQTALRNALVEAVTGTYYANLAAREADKVAHDSIAAIRSELEQTRKRYEAGTVLKADVLSLQVQLSEAEATAITTANNIEVTHTGLGILLGLPATSGFSIASASQLTKPVSGKSVNDLIQQALAVRPELQAAAKQVAIREQEVKTEEAAYLPRADAFVSYGQDSQEPGFSAARDNFTAGVSVEMDLFNGFNTKNRVSAAKRLLAEAQQNEQKTRLTIEQEVKLASLNMKEALARLQVSEAAVAAADEALRLVGEQRRAETVTVTRYLEAEAARNKAHANSIAALYDALSAEAALKKAVGN